MRYFALCLVATLAACSTATDPPHVLEFRALNGSGVVGTLTLSSAGEARTLVEIGIAPNGHDDMPAHVHPGPCEDPVPQPVYPLENVRDGVSSTEIPVSVSELTSKPLSVNLHHSNGDMETFAACVDLT